ncbi:hypothetical protein [Aquimarina aquimarini]|uniref:hypothetical protein n=1 Tax=Aquimarina aquimarini TaxID=1191734 RepID=UPI000D558F55|nr:hypothetical protein [Aquimarina aquimarini]
MKNNLEEFLCKIDLEKLEYLSLDMFASIVLDNELEEELSNELPKGSKLKDVKISYNETTLHINREEITMFIIFDLLVNKDKIGSYKTQYSLDEEDFIDDYLILD